MGWPLSSARSIGCCAVCPVTPTPAFTSVFGLAIPVAGFVACPLTDPDALTLPVAVASAPIGAFSELNVPPFAVTFPVAVLAAEPVVVPPTFEFKPVVAPKPVLAERIALFTPMDGEFAERIALPTPVVLDAEVPAVPGGTFGLVVPAALFCAFATPFVAVFGVAVPPNGLVVV
jgi:hypothetical protein